MARTLRSTPGWSRASLFLPTVYLFAMAAITLWLAWSFGRHWYDTNWLLFWFVIVAAFVWIPVSIWSAKRRDANIQPAFYLHRGIQALRQAAASSDNRLAPAVQSPVDEAADSKDASPTVGRFQRLGAQSRGVGPLVMGVVLILFAASIFGGWPVDLSFSDTSILNLRVVASTVFLIEGVWIVIVGSQWLRPFEVRADSAAEWLCSGLQIRVCRFDSGPGLHKPCDPDGRPQRALRGRGGSVKTPRLRDRPTAAARRFMIRSSSAVEQATVNRQVAGSNPASGANSGPPLAPGAALFASGVLPWRRLPCPTKRSNSSTTRWRSRATSGSVAISSATASTRAARAAIASARGVRARTCGRRAALRPAARRGRADPPVPGGRLRRRPPSLDLGGRRRDHRARRIARGADPARGRRGGRARDQRGHRHARRGGEPRRLLRDLRVLSGTASTRRMPAASSGWSRKARTSWSRSCPSPRRAPCSSATRSTTPRRDRPAVAGAASRRGARALALRTLAHGPVAGPSLSTVRPGSAGPSRASTSWMSGRVSSIASATRR